MDARLPDRQPEDKTRARKTRGGSRILIIDGDAAIRKDIAEHLKEAGFQTLEAENGEQGLAIFQEQKPDLVLCELQVTNSKGTRIIKTLTTNPTETPIIIISTWASAWMAIADVLECLRLNASDYFIKPIFDYEVLILAVRRSLDQARLKEENVRYRRKLEQVNRELRKNLRLLERDQIAGRQVQLKMLPEQDLQAGLCSFSHRIIPSLYLSGDFIDYLRVGSDHVFFLVADVAGHGVSSAFVTILLKNLSARLRSFFNRGINEIILSPADFMKTANEELLGTAIGKYATMFAGVLKLPQNTLRYGIAGHLPAPVLAGDGKARFLTGRSGPVGMFEDLSFEEHTLELGENFSLTVFSDGIFEVLPQKTLAEKEQYLLELAAASPPGLEPFMQKLHLANIQLPPDDIAILNIRR